MRFYAFWIMEALIVWLIGGTIAVAAWAIGVAMMLALVMLIRGHEDDDDGDWTAPGGPVDDPTAHEFPLAH